jgi:tetratricopeptide (TPR) repeat protein
MGIDDEIVRLFREAIAAENANDLEAAKRKFDKILELSRGERPEAYFEACFRMADVFIQEDNYRGAVKCALRGICRAPSRELRRAGIQRLGDVLFIMKRRGRLGVLTENMDPALNLTRKEDPELYEFTVALTRLASGEKVRRAFPTEELTEILNGLQG